MLSSRTRLFIGATCLFLAAIDGPGNAAEPSGTTIAVIPAAAAAGALGRRILKVQGPVFMGDVVETGSVGEAQIEFRDNTRLVVGSNSRMTIDGFVFDQNNTSRKISMNAAKGAFRFITGNSKKQAYSIRTPTSTIGIRGTRFDLFIAPNGETSFALFEGEARLCSRATGVCRDVQGSCAVVVMPPTGEVLPVRSTQQKADRLRKLFPYVVSQARLRPEFRVNTSGCQMASVAPFTQDRMQSLGLSPTPSGPPSGPPSVGNPGNTRSVGNAGDKFGGDGTRGESADARGKQK